MTGPIDTAYVEIEPRLDNFSRDAQSGVERGLDASERTIRSFAEEIERVFSSMTSEISNDFARMGTTLGRRLDEIATEARGASADVTHSLNRMVDEQNANARQLSESFDRAFREIRRDAATTSSSINKSLSGGISLLKTGIVAGATAAGYGLYQLGSFGLQSAGQIEQLQTSFNSLLGSVEKGQAVFTDLQNFAAETPFEFPDVAKGAARFLAFNDSIGMTDDQLRGFLTTIGNVISVTGGGAQALDSVTLAMGQIASSGKITLDNLNQISEAMPGFSGVAAIASATGLTTAQVMDKISRGELDAKTGMDALLKGMADFPGAAGAMEMQSKTLLGVFSTFKDTMAMSLSNAFVPVIPAIKDALTQLTPVLKGALDVIAPALGNVLAAIMPLIGGLVQALSGILGPLLDGLAKGLAAMGPAIKPLGDALGNIAVALAPILPMLGTLIGALAGALAPIIQALVPAITAIVNAFQPLIGPISDALTTLGMVLGGVLSNATMHFAKAFATVGPILASVFTKLAGMLMPVLIELAPTFRQIQAASAPLLPALIQLIPPLVEIVVALTPLILLAAQLTSLVVALVAPLIKLGATLISFAVVNVIAPIISAIASALSWLLSPLEPLVGYISAFVMYLSSLSWSDIGSAISGAFVSAWNAVTDFFSQLPGRIVAFLTGLPGTLSSLASKAFDAFFFAVGYGIGAVIKFTATFPGKMHAIFTALWTKAKTIFTSGIAAIVSFVSRLPGTVAEYAQRMRNTMISLFNSAATSVTNVMRNLPGKIKNALASLPGAVKGAASGAKDWLYSAGQAIVNGMINGVKSMVNKLVATAKNAAKSAIKGAKAALGISSPSKEFFKLGVNTGDGFIGGVDSRVTEIKNTVSTMMSPDSITKNVTNISNTSSGSSGFSGTIIVKIGDKEFTDVVVDVMYDNSQDVTQSGEQGSRKLARR